MGWLQRLLGGEKSAVMLPGDVATIGDHSKMRKQHYTFAHQALPQVAMSNPPGVVASLTQDGEGFLGRLWAMAGEGSAAAGQPVDASFKPGLLRRVVNKTAWFVISLPQPRTSPEAFFVGLGFQPGESADQWDVAAYTLELSLDVVASKPTTVMGAWAPGGRHLNFGQLEIALTPEAFLDACIARMD